MSEAVSMPARTHAHVHAIFHATPHADADEGGGAAAGATPAADPALVVGELLEAIDYSGRVTRDVLRAFAPLALAAGRPGGRRWELAVELCRAAAGEVPTAAQLEERWRATQDAQQGVDRGSEAAQAAPRGPQSPSGAVEALPGRQGRLQRFLRDIGYEVPRTAEITALYGPLVDQLGRRGGARWRAAVSLASNAAGKTPPTPDQVEIEVHTHQRRAEAHRAAIRAEALRVADRAREYVEEVRARTGSGPTRAETRRHLAVPSSRWRGVIDELHRLGALSSTSEHRSLATTSDWTSPLTGPA